MNENEFTVTFVAVEPSKIRRCIGCIGEREDEICKILTCQSEKRADGRNVIFKIKETK